MDNFKAIYKILRLLDKHKGDESFDYALISAKAVKLDYAAWEQLLIEMQIAGYIRGIVYSKSLTDKFPHIAEPIEPCITIKGMEYLANNSMMSNAKELLRTVGDIV